MLALALLVLSATADGGAPDAGAGLDRRVRELMHTEVTLALSTTVPAAEREAAFREGFAVFEAIERDLNEWKPGSPLARLNQSAGQGAVRAPPPLCEVLGLGLDGARRTGGLFDPTWAALRELWRFDGPDGGVVPSRDAVARACSLVGYQQVTVKPRDGGCEVSLAKPGVALGLGGLVKGWGVDQVVAAFRRRGLADFYVQAGGDLYVGGTNNGHKWKVGIRDPRGSRTDIFARAELTDTAFSTSGDYEHFFTVEGVRYHHIIDPRSCWPANKSVSVTVLAKSATDAEILTKAGFIAGPEASEELMRSFGASAVWVTPDGKVRGSAGLQGRIEVREPSGFDAGR